MSTAVELRDPTFAESLAIESYKAAASGALTASDSFADKVVTAAFSAATAYGPVIALVAPKDSQSSLLVVLPFVALVPAVGSVLYAQSIAIDLTATNDPNQIRTRISGADASKRLWGRVAQHAEEFPPSRRTHASSEAGLAGRRGSVLRFARCASLADSHCWSGSHVTHPIRTA